jgi:hypothetical protein
VKACIGSLAIDTVVKFQDVRDELRGDNVGVVTAKIVKQLRGVTNVRCIRTDKKFVLFHHHSVEVIDQKAGS